MHESIATLQRARGRYADELRRQNRRLQKAAEGSEEARAAQHNIDTIIGRIADLDGGLTRLEGG